MMAVLLAHQIDQVDLVVQGTISRLLAGFKPVFLQIITVISERPANCTLSGHQNARLLMHCLDVM